MHNRDDFLLLTNALYKLTNVSLSLYLSSFLSSLTYYMPYLRSHEYEQRT